MVESNSQTPEDIIEPHLVLEALKKLEEQGGEKTVNGTKSNQGMWILIFSAILFVFVAENWWGYSGSDLILLILVLLFHELGHFIAMKLFKYKDVKMFFIPFFGAAVTGTNREATTLQKTIMYLAGPAPGMALSGLIFGYLYLNNIDSTWLNHFAALLLIINAFNLLPIYPLDGGRFFGLIFAGKAAKLESVFKLISVVALVGLGYYWSSWALYIFSTLMLFSVMVNRYIKKSVKNYISETREFFDFSPDHPTKLPFEELKKIIKSIAKEYGHPDSGAIKNTEMMAKLIPKFLERLKAETSSSTLGNKQIIGYIFLYVLAWILPFLPPFTLGLLKGMGMLVLSD